MEQNIFKNLNFDIYTLLKLPQFNSVRTKSVMHNNPTTDRCVVRISCRYIRTHYDIYWKLRPFLR